MRKQNLIYQVVLNVLFTPKQLKKLVEMGQWTSEDEYVLPHFYFKDKNTLAFPFLEHGQEHLTARKSRSKEKRSRPNYGT